MNEHSGKSQSYESTFAPPKTLPLASKKLAAHVVSKFRGIEYFSQNDYYDLNPDVASAGIDPHEHAMLFGAGEGRRLFKATSLAKALASVKEIDTPATNQKLETSKQERIKSEGISIYVSSVGNVFMQEIANDLAENIRDLDIPVRILDETAYHGPPEGVVIYVAPHEFFFLGQGCLWLRDENIENAFMYNTEQLASPWFAVGVPVLLAGKAVFDISSQSAALFRSAGIPAMHWEPWVEPKCQALDESDKNHSLLRVLPPRARDTFAQDNHWLDRPIDISFFGTESPRREAIFARYCQPFSEYEACIYYRRQSLGVVGMRFSERALGRIAGYVSQRSKISLNIHRDEFCYFEWHRMVRQGMAAGSVVVSDPCLPHPHFRPGIHYFQEDARHIPNLVDWILRDREGQEKAVAVVAAATNFLTASENRRARTRTVIDFISEQLWENQ
jgi:hypothetical protein